MIQPQADKTPQQQAGEWVFRQHSDAWTGADQRALEAWLAESEDHAREYARALRLWRELDGFKTLSFPAREAVRHRYRPTRRRRYLPQAAAALIAAVLVLAVGVNFPTETTYQTGKGGHQSITLADGSRLDINTDTELRVSLSKTSRLVTLVRGEVFFNVAHHEHQPFEVVAQNGHIRDIGTRFDVYATAGRVEVSVEEGRVEVSTAKQPGIRLAAGQQLSYADTGEIAGIKQADAEAASAWREGRLVFNLTPLAEVAAQLSRYHPVEFVFADAKLKNLKVTGRFDIGNLPLLLETLQAALPVKAEASGPHTFRLSRKRG